MTGRPNKEQRKRLLYPVAAQIKLLVDTPEQICIAMEDHFYLRAARLYLIAERVVRNLQASPDAASLKIPTSFPVVKRQWDAVSHFRSQVIQKSTEHLKLVDQSEQSVAETLCAIMLLSNATPKGALEKLLEMRKSAVFDLLHSFEKNSNTIAAHFCNVIHLVESTLRHVANIFLVDSTPRRRPSTVAPAAAPPTAHSLPPVSLLAARINSLMQRPGQVDAKSATTPPADHQIANLYSEKTNVHVIFRHLPPSIQTFTPYLNAGTAAGGALTSELVRRTVRAWLDGVALELRVGAGELLAHIASGKTLAAVRSTVLELVRKIERGAAPVGLDTNAGIEAMDWTQFCLDLLEGPFSLWTDVFRSVFSRRAEDIIRLSFEPLVEQPSVLVKAQLDALQDESNPDRNMSDFIWRADEVALTSTQPTTRTQTAALTDIGDAFETALQLIKTDVEPLLSTRKSDAQQQCTTPSQERKTYAYLTAADRTPAPSQGRGEEEEDPFDLKSDAIALQTLIQEVCAKAVEGYRDGIAAMLQQTAEAAEGEKDFAAQCTSDRIGCGQPPRVSLP
ncbi:hypothetical protein BDK51DRAFT_47052 [Blyttiomyces helicus]|uniref:Conserved oligomeric Golgi complex subunit 1 n=1 Tax=Blyttiomyces helicus TaxID=388810 RepID=A0A4P9VWE8_9FUNG|nr:hypothetical protein BDK51DRAFT_47052 [Blyttiomyces helicus]|eukprot:RKO84021.1 hypothetical protein BDK51DRAFT_47052 [Blyttiomyces helicus]